MWVRFIDERGERLGDREMFQVPDVGDQIDLSVEKKREVDSPTKMPELEDRTYRVGRRLWTPDTGWEDSTRLFIRAILVLEAK